MKRCQRCRIFGCSMDVLTHDEKVLKNLARLIKWKPRAAIENRTRIAMPNVAEPV